MASLYDDPGIHGRFIVWIDYGYGGWQPYSFDTVEEAVSAAKQASSGWVLTPGAVKLIPEQSP